MSKETGDTATIVKLLRVAMLLPVVLLVSFAVRRRADIDTRKAPLLPLFGVAFFALVVVNSLGWVPRGAADVAGGVSRWWLVAATAAIGMKTSPQEASVAGMRPGLLIGLQTVGPAGLARAL